MQGIREGAAFVEVLGQHSEHWGNASRQRVQHLGVFVFTLSNTLYLHISVLGSRDYLKAEIGR